MIISELVLAAEAWFDMDFIKAIGIGELPPGAMKEVTIGGKEILLANVAGKFYAIGGRCTHRQGVLAKGMIEGNVVTCPRHGSMFDVTTGKNLGGPKQLLGGRGTTGDEPSYEVKVEGESVLVKI